MHMAHIDTNCTRPVLFENEDLAFPYSQRGTAFFVNYRNKVYAITAYHVVADFHPRQLRLLRLRNGGECFEYKQPFCGNRILEESLYDFVVIPLCDSVVEVSRYVFAWPLPKEQPIPASMDRIFIDGYPDVQRDTNYDNASLEFQGGIVQTRYDEESANRGIYRLRVTSEHQLPTFSGFSGSPAYITPPHDCTLSDTNIFGVTILGKPDAGIFSVIGILAVKVLIDEYLMDKED